MFDNGVAMTPAPSPFHAAGQNPGQAGLAGGFTSVPVAPDNIARVNINTVLGLASYSSGIFRLDPGVNNITGVFVSQPPALDEDLGIAEFIVEPSTAAIPEPATWAMLILGVGLIGVAARRRSQGMALTA